MSRRLRRVLAALALLALGVTIAYDQRTRWLPALAGTLICDASAGKADAIVIDNVEPNHLLFQRARELQEQGLAATVLVPIPSMLADGSPSTVQIGFMEVMCGVARVSACTPFPVHAEEPISLGIAQEVSRELQARGVRSILLVTGELRSKRTDAAYRQVLAPLAIRVDCQPVAGSHTTANWYRTTHGIQDVVLQLGKLWYYRLAVLT